MTKEHEFKQRLVDFVKNVGTEFPNVGKKMKDSMQEIEADIMQDFSPELVQGVGSYVGRMMRDETSLYKNTKDTEDMIRVIDEHILIEDGNGNAQSLTEVRKLRRCLELELESEKLVKKNISVTEELDNLIGDGSLLEADLMVGIFSGYVEMAKGKKPEEVLDLAKNLDRAEKIMKLFSLKEQADEINRAKQAIMDEIGSSRNLLNTKKMKLAREIVSLKIRRLRRNLANYENVREKKDTQDLLGKIEMLIRIGEKEIAWNKISVDFANYFAAEITKSEAGCCVHAIPGMFNAR
ncbi:MAG: hypothetical protein WC788_05725 [Candidatus Paceibacterota bacterium]|jgi:predicted DNA-binding protein YlxM (UPF0122 family)